MYLDAVKTYYNSMANVRRLKASGKYKEKIVKQRKKNRISNVSLNFLITSLFFMRAFLLCRN
jgi:hypothetical protein